MPNNVEIIIKGDSTNAVASTGVLAGSLARLGTVLAASKGQVDDLQSSLLNLARNSIISAKDQKIGIQELSLALKNIGIDYADVEDSIEDAIRINEEKTNYSDEQQREALTHLVREIGNFDRAMEALPATLDLAAASQQDLGVVSQKMGSFLNKTTDDLGLLGIEATKGAEFTDRLDDVVKKAGGSAEAARDPFIQLDNSVRDLGQALADPLLPSILQITDNIKIIVQAMADWLDAHPDLYKWIGQIALALSPLGLLVQAISAAIETSQSIWENWDAIVKTLKETFKEAFQEIKEIFEEVTETLLKLFDSKWSWLLPEGDLTRSLLLMKSNWDQTWTGVKETVQKVWEEISSIIENAAARLRAPIDLVIGGVNKAQNIIGGVSNLGSNLFSRISVPGFAEGGNVLRGGLALVGERGPELVSLPAGARVAPLAGAGDAPVQVFNDFAGATIIGIEDLDFRIEQTVTRALRRASGRRR